MQTFRKAQKIKFAMQKCWPNVARRVWRYQRGNQNPYIAEEQTTQWPNEKGQQDKQQSKKYTHKTRNRVPRTLLKTGGALRCSGRVSRSCSSSYTRHLILFYDFIQCSNTQIKSERGSFVVASFIKIRVMLYLFLDLVLIKWNPFKRSLKF